MANIWKAQVTVASVGIGGTLADGVTTNPNEGSYLFGVLDDIGIGYAIEARLIVDPGTLFYDSVYYACVSNFAGGSLNSQANDWWGEPPLWFYILSPLGGGGTPQNITAADNGAAWLAGGTLSITKDFALNLITFTTPLGSMTIPLSTFTSTQVGPPSPDDGPFVATWMGHGLAVIGGTLPAYDTERWGDFFTYRNGVLQPAFSTALSLADPGSWVPGWDQFEFKYPSSVGFFGTHPTNDFQDSASYKTECIETTFPLQGNGMTESRQFLGPTTAACVGPDLAAMNVHAALLGTWAVPPAHTTLTGRRSHDGGHTWFETIAATGDTYSSPSIQILEDTAIILYEDQTTAAILQTVSRDLGITWSTPVPVSIMGACPRLVISPDGIMFYFCINASAQIVLQRSMDGGATLFDASPLVVATMVPMQAFGATLMVDGGLRVSYADAGNNWKTRVSRDYGLSWIDA